MLIRITRCAAGYYEIVEPYEHSADLLVATAPIFPKALQYVFEHYNDAPNTPTTIRVVDYTEKSMDIEVTYV